MFYVKKDKGQFYGLHKDTLLLDRQLAFISHLIASNMTFA